MFWCGITSIGHLCAIAIDRCIIMNNPIWAHSNRDKTPYSIFAMIVFCWLYGFIWAVLPLLGESFLANIPPVRPKSLKLFEPNPGKLLDRHS